MKLLGVKKPNREFSPIENFQYVQNHWTFLQDGIQHDNYATITPFVVITDGKNIIISEDEMEAEIGFRFFIEKPPGLWKHNIENFSTIIENGIREKLFEVFDNIEVKINNHLHVTLINSHSSWKTLKYNKNDKENDLLKLISTNRGGFNYSGNKFLPIYFLKISSEKLTKFYPRTKLQLMTIPIEKFIKTGLIDFPRLGFMSKVALVWMRSGEILFPVN